MLLTIFLGFFALLSGCESNSSTGATTSSETPLPPFPKRPIGPDAADPRIL